MIGVISSTFYNQLFPTKVSFKAFLYSQFGFVIFWQKKIGTKAVHKMMMKLIPALFVLWSTQKIDKSLFLLENRDLRLQELRKC